MLDFLSQVLRDYCNLHDLEHLSADDLLYESINHGEADCYTQLTIEQEEWLQRYIEVWNLVENCDNITVENSGNSYTFPLSG